jgi:hypothetical protein
VENGYIVILEESADGGMMEWIGKDMEKFLNDQGC